MDFGKNIRSGRKGKKIETLAAISEKVILIATALDAEMPVARQELPRGIIARERR